MAKLGPLQIPKPGVPKSGVPKTGGAQFGVRKTGLQNWGVPKTARKPGCLTAHNWGCPNLGCTKVRVPKTCHTHLPESLSQRPPTNKHKRRIAAPTSPRPCRRGPQQQTQTKNCHTHLPESLLLAKAQQKQTQTKNCHTHPESLSQRPLSNKHKQRIAAPTNTNEELPHLPPREPVAKAPQQQTQTKNCCTHLPDSLLSQRPCSNKHKRRIATPTSPRACRKSRSATNTNEELPHPPPREPVAKALQQQTQTKNCQPPREPVAKAAQQQTQTKNCCTHLPESLLSQRCRRNKRKRRIVRKTSGERLCSSGVAPETIPTDPSPGAQLRVPN